MQTSLGMITITPGSPQRATANLADPDEPYYVHAYTIQRLSVSSGKIFVQVISSNIQSKSGLECQMLAELNKSVPAFGAGITNEQNSMDLSHVWIDGDVAGDKAIIAALEQ